MVTKKAKEQDDRSDLLAARSLRKSKGQEDFEKEGASKEEAVKNADKKAKKHAKVPRSRMQ